MIDAYRQFVQSSNLSFYKLKYLVQKNLKNSCFYIILYSAIQFQ